MYSLVSAPVLGFDLTRLSGGSATAEVLLRGLRLQDSDLQVLAFQAVEPYVAPDWPDPERPQQFHLDFHVASLDLAHSAVLASGARLLESTRGWRVYADPAGHPFCLVGK